MSTAFRTLSTLAVLVSALPLVSSCEVSSSHAQGKSRDIERAKPLPREARDILRSRMERHAVAMDQLMWASVVLDYDSIRSAAEDIAKSPPIARPGSGPQNPLNALLPERYFQLQDELYTQTDNLMRAATAHDDMAIADAFSELSGTCMSCHSVYLRFDPE